MNTATEAPATETRSLVLKNRASFLKVSGIARENQELMSSVESTMEQTYVMACSLSQIKRALTPEIMEPIMALQGSKLGFKTDKPYPVEVVKDVTAEALLLGLRMTGNEVNIISGGLYPAQAGLERLVNEMIDVGTYVDHQPDLPQVKDGKWTCEYTARYKFRDKDETAKRVFSGRHFGNATSDDQIIGKCRRKMLLEIHRRMTGVNLGDAEADDIERMKNVTPQKQASGFGAGMAGILGVPDAQPAPTATGDDREGLIKSMQSAMLDHGVTEERLMRQAREIKAVPEGIDELFALSTDTLRKLSLAIPSLSTNPRK